MALSCPCLFPLVFETCLCVKGLSIGSQVEITSELSGPGWDMTASQAGVTLSALHDLPRDKVQRQGAHRREEKGLQVLKMISRMVSTVRVL